MLLGSNFICVELIYLVVKFRTGLFPEVFSMQSALKYGTSVMNTVRQYAFAIAISEIQH